jgi:hypothetical protein
VGLQLITERLVPSIGKCMKVWSTELDGTSHFYVRDICGHPDHTSKAQEDFRNSGSHFFLKGGYWPALWESITILVLDIQVVCVVLSIPLQGNTNSQT